MYNTPACVGICSNGVKKTIYTGINCGGLPDPVNGKVRISSSMLGGIALYTCSPGYDVVGEVRRECLCNSTWSGSKTVCQGLYNTHFHANIIVRCMWMVVTKLPFVHCIVHNWYAFFIL